MRSLIIIAMMAAYPVAAGAEAIDLGTCDGSTVPVTRVAPNATPAGPSSKAPQAKPVDKKPSASLKTEKAATAAEGAGVTRR